MTRCDPRPPAPRLPIRWAALAVIASLAAAFPGPPVQAGENELNGPAEVIDGNSIAIGGRVVRLYGIDAPDEQQMCERQGGSWRCGQDAGWALAERLERHWVLCEPKSGAPGADPRADAVPAVCYLEGRQIDVNAWMVAQGWALADPGASIYVAEEQTAQHAGRGLWAGKFDPPWVWRAEHREP